MSRLKQADGIERNIENMMTSSSGAAEEGNRFRERELTRLAFDLRKLVLEMITRAGTGHIGGDFSVMEILVDLYFDQMRIDPDREEDPDRDYFVLSKGHAVESYYAVLAARGFLDQESLLSQYSQFGSEYIGHPNNHLPGIEMNSGSLGHGLPVCLGMALACKRDQRTNRVYTVLGDGELAEGSVWEGFMAAGQYQLDNLCAVIDCNGLQISGPTESVMNHRRLADQVRSFDWHVIETDGNSISRLRDAFEEAGRTKGLPTCIIAHTTKGYGGGPLMENQAAWHHHVPDAEEARQILRSIEEKEALL